MVQFFRYLLDRRKVDLIYNSTPLSFHTTHVPDPPPFGPLFFTTVDINLFSHKIKSRQSESRTISLKGTFSSRERFSQRSSSKGIFVDRRRLDFNSSDSLTRFYPVDLPFLFGGTYSSETRVWSGRVNEETQDELVNKSLPKPIVLE